MAVAVWPVGKDKTHTLPAAALQLALLDSSLKTRAEPEPTVTLTEFELALETKIQELPPVPPVMEKTIDAGLCGAVIEQPIAVKEVVAI